MKGIQRFVAFAAISCFSAAAQAGWEGNWLVGGSAGYEHRSGNLTIYTFNTLTAEPLSNEIIETGNSGFIWGFLGGYQAKCNGWLFGLEFNIDWHDHDGSKGFAFTDTLGNGYSGTAHYHRQVNVGASGRFGHLITSSILAYIRLGAESSEDEIHISMFSPGVPVNLVDHDSRRQYRFVGGFGAEMPFFYENLTMRLEYNYHSRGKDIEVVAVGSDGVTGLIANAHPHNQTLRGSLVWNFL